MLTPLCLLVAVIAVVSGELCPTDGSCPDLSSHEIDLSPLQGVWDTLYYTQSPGSVVANIPHFFNISVCGSLHASQCAANSSVCYSSELSVFYNLGNTSSCQYSYNNRSVTFTYGFSSEDRVKQLYGSGNVSITLLCGRTLGVPEVVLGDPNADEIVILWETSAACKTSSSLHYTQEAKCYHIHTYNDNGLRADFIDLTSLVQPQGYSVLNSEDSSVRFLLSVCKPLSFAGDDQHPAGCNGSMACLVGAGGSLGASVPLVVGNWSSRLDSRLHMHEGLPTVEYSVNMTKKETCEGVRNIRVHFLCPTENQVLGPHVTFMDSQVCLTIVTWYTSFACGRAAIQTQSCFLTTQGGLTFNFTSLGSSTRDVNSTTDQLDSAGNPYTYSLQICRGNSLFNGCSPPPPTDTRVVQVDSSGVCRSLGTGHGNLRYADGTLSLTYSHGDTCHSNFARTTLVTFLCPKNLDGETSDVSTVRFLGEEDCFYQFEWVTDLACGSKTSGVADCQFQLPHGGTYNFAPLVGTEDQNWVSVVAGEPDVACFMINPCGELKVTQEAHATGVEYCNQKHAPSGCSGASVCRIASDGSVTQIGMFDLGDASSIKSADSNVVSVLGRVRGASSNNTAVIHYVCKTGDLFSAPVYVGVTNEQFYEFHWATFAACPSGIQSGSQCTVSYQGFLFNLNSIPVLTFNDTDYTYEIAVCSSLRPNQTHCTDGDSHDASACQVQRSGGHHYKLGQSNSTLLYEDGTLKLVYKDGQKCRHKPWPRNTTVLFICDSTAHAASVSSVTEDECEYVVEVRTKLACPPAVRATECIFLNGTNSYDFSDLSRSLYRGNWEARGPDGAVFYINVCQPLNRMPGCSALAGACKKVVSHDGHVTYTDIGMASDAQFSVVRRDGEDRITLTYQHHSQTSQCPSIHTTIEFICNKTTFNSEVGPYYASGGDEQNPCQYTFLWETTGACPIKPIKSSTCQLKLPSGFTFDLSPLHSPPNDSNHEFYQITTSSDQSQTGTTFDLGICGSLPSTCNGQTGVSVCQTDSVKKVHACGRNSTQQLVYFDGSMYLKYSDGDLCHHNHRNRSVLINFECDRTASLSTTMPRYLREDDCGYSFEWPTPLACEPQELECVAAGGKYDLTPLLGNRHWEVDTKDAGGSYVYVIGGCRSLDFEGLPRCPQVPGMGACRYPSSGGDVGSNLGYVMGDLVEQGEGTLLLEYHNGDTCGDGTRSMVHVHFTCGAGAGTGVPSLAPFSDRCHTHINWVTQYACSRSARSMNWTITDPVTSNVFNFTTLPSQLSRVNTAQDGSLYNYTVSLNGGTISCNSSHSLSGPAGACQVKVSGGCNSSTPSCVHTLGVLGTNSSSLSMTDGEVRAEYRNGDKCHHAAVERKSVIMFECDSRDEPFLEVMPENMCEYTFVVHTKLACPHTTNIGVECRVEGFHDLVAFQRMPGRSVKAEGKATLFISVCDALGTSVPGCDSGSASCLQDGNGHYVNLGKPSSRFPPTAMEHNRGVVLTYVEGDMCNSGSGARWNTTLLLLCKRDVHVGTPEFLTSASCQYTIRWESSIACSTDLPSSISSNSACSLVNPYSNDEVLDFEPFLKNLDLTVPDNHGGTYMLQLCGPTTPLQHAAGCGDNNGICHHRVGSGGGVSKEGTVVYANHTFSMVSHSPRVVDIIFHSGVKCESDGSRTLSASVQLVCSRQSESPVPVLVSDSDCELRFVWHNQSFCSGEGASGGCSATEKSGYVYSLDGLLAQNWTGLVSPTTSGSSHTPSMGGTFSLGICRNLNPFSSSGLKCSTPSAVCWHTTDNRYINLGRSMFPPEVVETTNSSSIHIAYSNGDVCNGTRQYHTDLYIHCAKDTSAPTLFYDGTSITHNCSYIISMNSPVACKNQLSTTNCTITTAAGVYNFTDIASTPKTLTEGSRHYKVCLCGNSSSCNSRGISNVSSTGDGSGEISLGSFRSLSVSSSTGGPKLSYYSGSDCPGHGTAKYQSWLFMECNRSASGNGQFTLMESASTDCMKVFAWYTNRACLSQQVSCSTTITTSSGSSIFYDFTPLHSHATPWKMSTESETYYINICGEIVNEFADDISSCGGDTAICVKPAGASAFSIATASTQQLYYDNNNIVMKFTGPESSICPGRPSRASIMMTCGLGGLSLKEKHPDCHYNFEWSTPYACQEKPQIVKACKDVKGSGDFTFYPQKIAGSEAHVAVGRLSVNICGPSSDCTERNASVCLDRTTTIGYSSNQTIMMDGYEMLVRMDGPNNRHAVISVVCLLKSNTAARKDSDNPLVLDNIAANGDHTYYYLTLFTKEGQGCDFVSPTGAPSASAGTALPTSKGGVTKSGATGVVITILVLLIAVLVLVIILALLYKKERRESLHKAFSYCTVGKSLEPVRYHKISARDEEQSLMANHSDSGSDEEEEEELVTRVRTGREEEEETAMNDGNSDDDDELINL